MSEDVFEQLGLTWPETHPDTGEVFATGKVDRRCEVQEVRRLPPNYPSRRVATAWETCVAYDGAWEDEYEVETAWRDLSDEEWAAALAQYERTKHDLIGFVPGKETIEGRFETASGSWARGVWDGKRWSWLETAWG